MRICMYVMFSTGHQTVLVHRESGVAAITVTAVGYQTSHLAAAAVLSGVSSSVVSHEKLYPVFSTIV